MAEIPTVKLNNSLPMPAFGLGTWQGVPGKEVEVGQAVKDAIDLGYRLLDCAHVYGNEAAIGKAIQEKIEEGVIKREDLFITSKLWCNFHKPDLVEPALKTTLKNLQLDYLDLYLIHWPQAFQEGDNLHPKDPVTGLYIPSNVDYVDTWTAMEDVYKKGLTKAIGVSNFNSKQIKRVLENCSVIPATNQIECHPYLNQVKLRKLCEENGIRVTAYSPLGGPRGPERNPNQRDVFTDEKIKEIGERYKKSPAQILLKYNLQLGNVIIPKSANKQRLSENMGIFDFCLSPEDMNFINTFDCNERVCKMELSAKHPDYPFPQDLEF